MLTIDEFKNIMRAVSGDDLVDPSGDVADTPLADLGYDSLAVLEITAIVQQRYEITVPDEGTERMTTPHAAVTYINQLQAATWA